VSREEYQRSQAGRLPDHVLAAFVPEGIEGWQRSSNHMEHGAVYETVADGPAPRQRALHVVVSNLDGWDTFGPARLEAPFPADHTLTVFSARGGPRTTQLAIEWEERDGSRWFAVVPLCQEWRRYVLGPKDFHYWQSNPARGKGDDAFDPRNAATLRIGLAFTHTGHVSGRHEYWVGPFGTAKMTPTYRQLVRTFTPPPFDTLYPAYKFFDSNDVASIAARDDQVLVGDEALPLPERIRCPHPRARGAGFGKGRAWRWIPLLEARSANGAWRGTPATLMIHAEEKCKGGVWASFGIGDHQWYMSPPVLRTIGRIARAMRRGVFIVDGGANYYTYFNDQDITLGVRVANLGKSRQTGITVRLRVASGNSRQVWHREWPLTLEPGAEATISDTWRPEPWPDTPMLCTAEIVADGQVIDRVAHEVSVWRPKRRKQFITVESGDLILDGKRWLAHGINYMPSSGIAMEDGDYFEHWIGARAYDPEVMERDLAHVKDMGFNSVSIFIHHQSLKAQNLLDLLRRLERIGLKANLSLRPGTPMDFLWPKMRELIEYYRLADNDTVFAYDLAWEPMFRKGEPPGQWDRQWQAWIIERYGSIDNAERDWGVAVPRDEVGKVTSPSRQQVEEDGDWRRMVAAYRRFLDTLLYRKYSAARRLVRSIDPNHLVSFRMANAGDPTFNWRGYIPYDWPYLAAAVDVLEPEAYGRIGDWERVKPGWFTYAYAQWAGPHLPMMWAEMGVSAWNRSTMAIDPERQAFQADYYRDFYRMLIGSSADGIFFWWYPGGFRCWENSDFGIINPDGTDRPVTRVIREHGRRFLQSPPAGPIDHWIETDRDAHPNGLTGIYAATKDAFWAAIDAGKTPGLKTAGTGTDSANCPLLAVGNTPCTGSNPPKYLDAVFEKVEVLAADGQWVAVEKGGSVEVRADGPVLARCELTNLGEAGWLPPENGTEPGTVSVIARGAAKVRTPIRRSVPRLESIRVNGVRLTGGPLKEPTEVSITLSAAERTPFGEKFTIRLVPASTKAR